MSAAAKTSVVTAGWADPGYFTQQSRARNALRVVKQLMVRPAGHKTMPTKAGMVLILLALGIGSAAYNTASNILFMTLALLLSCLLLSGLLSWVNFKGVRWRLVTEPHGRAGEVTPVRLVVENGKKQFPTYSLWFHLLAEGAGLERRLPLENRLEAGRQTTMEWMFAPVRRGHETIVLAGLESQFPFGFLRKTIAHSYRRELVIWPARLPYVFHPHAGKAARREGLASRAVGGGTQLINLRGYRAGDPPRLIHWKASARLRRFLVRETAEEDRDSYLLTVETPAGLWSAGPQFENLCSLAASLAEDLYMAGQLWGLAVNEPSPQPIQRLADLHEALGKLAGLVPEAPHHLTHPLPGPVCVSFTPGPANSVIAHVDGRQIGST